MIGIKVEGLDALERHLSQTSSAVERAMAKGVMRAAQETTGIIRKNIYSGMRGRTGDLARSFKETFLGEKGGSVSAGSFSDLSYARIQEEGGTIHPRTRRYLAVPLVRTPVGKWPRHFSDLVLVRSRRGNLLLARVSKSGRMTPHFVLKPSVRLRGRGYLAASIREAQAAASEAVGAQLALEVDKIR